MSARSTLRSINLGGLLNVLSRNSARLLRLRKPALPSKNFQIILRICFSSPAFHQPDKCAVFGFLNREIVTAMKIEKDSAAIDNTAVNM
ncbi:hypothetical protein A7Q26_05500 [Sphingobium sp. TCM1]|nr:hypothetical protein A7Q26_05500 [Sphingobium sp. TCM1]